VHALQLASCLIYARALLEYVIFIWWLRSVSKMLPSVKCAEDPCSLSLFSVNNAECHSESNLNPNPNFQSRLIR